MAKKLIEKTAEPELKKVTYFQQRMEQLGITPEINKIALHKTELQTGKAIMEEVPIFREVDLGIEILVYTLDRLTIRIEKNGSRQKRDFAMLRLKEPIIKPGGESMKYVIPKGAGTHPFFPPGLLDKYEAGDQIPTLFLVEGYFKAFKAWMHGADIVGLSSITHMKETGKNTLHPEILKLMTRCNVQRMVWLTDGDALDISQKEITDNLDLYKRPNGFFQSVSTFKTLLADYVDIEKWFLHIDTEALWHKYGNINLFNDQKIERNDLKGIDDLLVSFPDKTKEIIQDMERVSGEAIYFQKFNISFGLGKVLSHFHLTHVKDFYLHHVERRPELKDKEFIFHGTRYRYDAETGDCKVIIPRETKDYFRVGDHYFKFINIPNQYGKPERQFHERKKTTIEDDHGKGFCKNVPKYEAFCNVPDHMNFSQVIEGCFNVYSPIDYQPDDEECFEQDFPTIMGLIRHVFGEKIVSFLDKEAKETKEYSMVDLAIDYFQLLYQQPQQKLPILCLVSAENNTGKSTVANFLRLMLGANVAIVGNADLSNDFNAHWATKSVVVCDETKIDKVHVVEKIKMLSTAKKIFMNAKGRGQVELDCFIKFVLITNNEDNFISISDQDIRYWIIKVPVLKQENPKLLDLLVEEMPAWLSFLNKRKLQTDHKNRMWFHPQLLKTDALRKVISQSQSAAEKELRYYLKELFLDTGRELIMMSATMVHRDVFRNSQKMDPLYLSRIIKDKLQADQFHVWTVEGLTTCYNTYDEAFAAAGVKFHGIEGIMIEGKIKKLYKVTRYSYPKMEEVFEGGKKENKLVEIHDNGRPYVFLRKNFVSEEEHKSIDIDPEVRHLAEMTNDGYKPIGVASELPFD